MITQADSLKFGVEYQGETHYDFDLRLPMVADNIAVLQEVGVTSNMAVRTALFARCLVKLGSIPQEAITYEFLSSNLVDDDFDVLVKAEGDLKKKRMRASPPSLNTDSPSSLSDSTASASPASSN